MLVKYSLSKFNSYSPGLVVGTSFHEKNHRELIKSLGFDLEEYSRADIVVELIPEPDNPHSPLRQAISVRWNNRVLGYISEDSVGKYQQIKRLAASGYTAVCDATYTAYEREIWDDYDYTSVDAFVPAKELQTRIELRIDDYNYLVPLNDPPVDGWTLLPIGSSLQVTKENEHYDHLLDFVPESGEGLLLATLHIVEGGVKVKFEQVEVRLDGEPIGVLTKQSSARFTDAVRHFDALGLTTVVYAKIKGSSLAAEVTIHALRANELSNEDLDPEISPLRKLVPFEPDPSNYSVPNAWNSGQSLIKRKPKPTKPKIVGAPIPSDVLEKQKVKSPIHLTSPNSSTLENAIQRNTHSVTTAEWFELLSPDATKRATPFQRGYVRGSIGRFFPNNRAPRMDYMTVGQAHRILARFGATGEALEKSGRDSMTLWWVLVALVNFIFFLLSFTGFGLAFFAIETVYLVWYFITRSKLPPPFGQK